MATPKPTADWRDLLATLAPTSDPSDMSDMSDPSEKPEAPGTAKDTLTIFYERKGRGGKQATIIAGFTCPDDELRSVASVLKQRLATGGSARGGEILIQGDRRADAAKALREMGYKVKGATA